MKNAIQYYYKIIPTNIHQVNKIYKFQIDNNRYILYPYERKNDELQEIYELHLYLTYIGIYCHKIILNNKNEIVSLINNSKYILLQINIENRRINIEDVSYLSNIELYDKKYNKILRKPWYNLWINKIDYIEYQISQFGNKYKKLRESSDYFIGIVETCISVISNSIKKNKVKGISHDRINLDSTTEEFYNPLNFIIDNRTRDISEYFKSCIYKDIDIMIELKKYIQTNNLNNNEIELLFIRILYPSIYIDKCELILNNKINEEIIYEITKKTENLEYSIKKIYNYLLHFYKITEIEWLKKI